jgi:hypothetical protein
LTAGPFRAQTRNSRRKVSARLNGEPFKSERWFVEPTGRIASPARNTATACAWYHGTE